MSKALRTIPRNILKLVTLIEKRCFNCNHRLCDTSITEGVVEIKCTKCGQINYVVGETEKNHA